jgi:long-chain fatty acid transport protein
MIKKLIFLTLFTISFGEIIFAGGFQLNECGARAMAQAGAFAARANDPSAIYFNPAGISYLKGTQVLAGVAIITPSISFRGPTNLNVNTQTDLESKTYTPINIYGTYAINDFLTAGLGIYNPFGLGTKWPDDWVGKSLSIKSEVQIFNVNPTIAVKILNNLSIAAGFNYSIGTVEIKKQASNFSPAAVVELKTDKITDGHGTGFNAGLLWKPYDNMSIGVSYRSQMDFDITGNAVFTPSRSIFPAGEVTTTMKLPSNAFLAAAYKPMEDLWIEFDAQFVGWSSYDKLELNFVNGTTPETKVSTTNKNYKDTWIFRIGGEYQLNECIMLRAGYLYDISPTPEETVDPMLPDSDRNGFCIGIGYKVNDLLHFDFTYFFLPFNQRTTNTQEQGFNGTYNTITHLAGLNIGFNL